MKKEFNYNDTTLITNTQFLTLADLRHNISELDTMIGHGTSGDTLDAEATHGYLNVMDTQRDTITHADLVNMSTFIDRAETLGFETVCRFDLATEDGNMTMTSYQDDKKMQCVFDSKTDSGNTIECFNGNEDKPYTAMPFSETDMELEANKSMESYNEFADAVDELSSQTDANLEL